MGKDTVITVYKTVNHCLSDVFVSLPADAKPSGDILLFRAIRSVEVSCMKQTLILIAMIALALCIDLSPVDLANLQNESIHVSIDGEVQNPGEYELPLYSQLTSLLEMAGTTASSDLSSLNPDTILKDHDRIIIPAVSAQSKAKVSINAASQEDLTELPGIGPSTAARIIAYREENGFFQQLEDLMNVKGIGPAKFDKVKDHISL